MTNFTKIGIDSLLFTSSLLILLAAVQTGCQRVDPDFIEAQKSLTPILHFDHLHVQLKKMNSSPRGYFDEYWPRLHTEIQGYLDDGQLTSLHVEQQELLCMDLHFLKRCFDGHVLKHHGDEIKAITDRLELSEETRALIDSLDGEAGGKR